MPARKQCPFCFAHTRLRESGELYEHRLTGGRLCNGSGRTYEDAKQAKAEGASTAKPSGRPDKQVEPEDIF